MAYDCDAAGVGGSLLWRSLTILRSASLWDQRSLSLMGVLAVDAFGPVTVGIDASKLIGSF